MSLAVATAMATAPQVLAIGPDDPPAWTTAPDACKRRVFIWLESDPEVNDVVHVRGTVVGKEFVNRTYAMGPREGYADVPSPCQAGLVKMEATVDAAPWRAQAHAEAQADPASCPEGYMEWKISLYDVSGPMMEETCSGAGGSAVEAVLPGFCPPVSLTVEADGAAFRTLNLTLVAAGQPVSSRHVLTQDAGRRNRPDVRGWDCVRSSDLALLIQEPGAADVVAAVPLDGCPIDVRLEVYLQGNLAPVLQRQCRAAGTDCLPVGLKTGGRNETLVVHANGGRAHENVTVDAVGWGSSICITGTDLRLSWQANGSSWVLAVSAASCQASAEVDLHWSRDGGAGADLYCDRDAVPLPVQARSGP